MSRPTPVDVVIVGGGPVGLLLAAELAGHGVRTLVLEERTSVREQPKATTLHARTGQILARGGYLPPPASPLPEGVARAPFRFAGMSGLDITAPASEPEPLLKRAQSDLEKSFELKALAAGARVLRGYRVTGLDRRADGVSVSARSAQGPSLYEAAYVVGADGARSTVRKLAGLSSETWPATVAALAGIVRATGPGAPEPGWHRTPRGWVMAKRAPEDRLHLRVLNCSRPHADHTLPVGLEELRRETSWVLGHEADLSEPRWLTRFGDFARLARQYRSGRVLLVGDAGHVHFPIGGQGLSTGLLDALDLGWKLAFTVRGTAEEGLLDSYEAERRPAARRVIDNVRAQVELMRPGNTPDSLEALAAQAGAGDSAAGLERLGLMISAQDTVLPPRCRNASPWEGRFLHNLTLTTPEGVTDVVRLLQDRLMLLIRFALVEGTGDAERRYEGRNVLRTVWAQPVAELPCTMLLLRPDGYIAWASDRPGDTGPLDRALSRWLAPAPHGQAGTFDGSAASVATSASA